MKHDNQLQIRVTEKEKAGFEIAADAAGITLSAWVRMALRTAAIRAGEDAGVLMPFIERIRLNDWSREVSEKDDATLTR